MQAEEKDIRLSSPAPSRTRKNLKNAAFFLVVAAGLAYLIFRGPALRSFLNLDILEILLLLSVSLLAYLVWGLGFKSLLRIFDVGLAFTEWFGLTVCNIMFNYYLPARGGLVVKAYFLKKKHGLSYPHYAALTAGSVFLVLATASFVGLVIVPFLSAVTGGPFLSLAVAFSLILLGLLLSGLITNQLLRLKLHRKFNRLNLFLLNLREGLSLFSEHKKYTLDFCLLTVLFLLIMAVRLHLCFLALDYGVKFWVVLLIMIITQFSFLISFIPGNLGIKEGVIVFSAGLFGIPADQALAAAILDRAVSLVIIFGFGFVYSKILLDRMGPNSWGYKRNS
jgi:uncharacterized protein (TIRG00374 family)